MIRSRTLAWWAVALAALQLGAGAGLALAPNPEGWLGGVLYACLYALPLLGIALMLRASRPRWPKTAGWSGLLLAGFYTFVVVVNWSGYSLSAATFAVAITVPTVVLDVFIFWTTVVRHGARIATQ